MPIIKVANFGIEYLQVLDESGNIDEALMPKLSASDIIHLYEWMILTRIFDETAMKLQREGRLLTYAPTLGQEAAQVGAAAALNRQDWVFPSFRENGAMLLRGFPAHLLYMYWAGDERGMKIPENVNCFSIAIPVGTHIPHAVGFAWGNKMQKKDVVTLVFFGDGATSKGDFHEALNFAGVFKTPLVAVIQNNQWAISVPVSRQTSSQTLAQKAISYGFKGVKVDGNDIFAVYKATREAVENARKGLGPTLIECFTFRMSHHTTADDWTRYRSKEEVEAWKKKDPIVRLERFMERKGILTEQEKDRIMGNAKTKIDDAIKAAEAQPPPDPKDIFKYIYAEMTENLKEQMEEMGG